jgi:cytochrome c-type biogenesis protein CcmH
MSAETMQLWGLAAVLAVAVLVIMLWPLIKRRGDDNAPREAYDINVYKDQLLEIDADLERGLLSEDQGEAARTEIKRRMLAAADSSDAVKEPAASGSNGLLIAAISLFVPVGAVLLYLNLGNPDQPDQPLAERKANTMTAQSEQDQEILEATAKLAQHLKSNPDDLRGWRLLGRTYLTQGRYGDSAAALGSAYKLAGDDPDVVVDYAEALTLAAQSKVTDQSRDLFNKVLSLDPTNPKSRYYLGMYAVQHGDIRGAMQEWVDLAAMSPPDAPWLQILDQQIERAAEESGIDPVTIEPSAEAKALAIKVREAMAKAQAEQQAAPAPTNADVKAALGMSEGDRSEMIRSMVQRLADRMKEEPTKDGWLRLEKAYRVLGETALADEAAASAAKMP